jgi:hypothetical protein
MRKEGARASERARRRLRKFAASLCKAPRHNNQPGPSYMISAFADEGAPPPPASSSHAPAIGQPRAEAWLAAHCTPHTSHLNLPVRHGGGAAGARAAQLAVRQVPRSHTGRHVVVEAAGAHAVVAAQLQQRAAASAACSLLRAAGAGGDRCVAVCAAAGAVPSATATAAAPRRCPAHAAGQRPRPLIHADGPSASAGRVCRTSSRHRVAAGSCAHTGGRARSRSSIARSRSSIARSRSSIARSRSGCIARILRRCSGNSGGDGFVGRVVPANISTASSRRASSRGGPGCRGGQQQCGGSC